MLSRTPLSSRCPGIQVITKLSGKKREESILEKEPVLKELHDKGALDGSTSVSPPGSKPTKVCKGGVPVRFCAGVPGPGGGSSGRKSSGGSSSSSGGMIKFDPSSHVSKTNWVCNPALEFGSMGAYFCFSALESIARILLPGDER